MNGLQELVLLGEIVLQSQIAIRASERLFETQKTFDKIEVWCSIQSILIASGNVSKLLWPPNKQYKLRGEKLRKILDIKENHLLSNRTFRNHFEHFDERIEKIFENKPGSIYVDLAMNPSLCNRDPNCQRGYNSFNNTLIFKGEILDFNDIINSLEDILKYCKDNRLVLL